MKKKQLMRALGTLVSCVVAAAMMMSGAVSASAGEPPEQTATHGDQPYVQLKIKGFKGLGNVNEVTAVKLADYTDQDASNNTLSVNTVSPLYNRAKTNYWDGVIHDTYRPTNDILSYDSICEASDYANECSRSDPMQWLVNKWNAEGDINETSAPYSGGIRNFLNKMSQKLTFNYPDWRFSVDMDNDPPKIPADTVYGNVRNTKVVFDEQQNPVFTFDVPNGIYMIAFYSGALQVIHPILVSTVGGQLNENSDLGTKEINIKGNTRLAITKKVNNKTYNIGDFVKYTINVSLPYHTDMYGNEHYAETLSIQDTFSKGLSYVPGRLNAQVEIDGQTVNQTTEYNDPDRYGFSVDCPSGNSRCVTASGEIPGAKLTFDLGEYVYKHHGKYLTIVYYAKLNGSAGTDATANEAKIVYKWCSSECETATAQVLATHVNVYTDGFSIRQAGGSAGGLAGAKFTVTRKSESKPIQFVKTSAGDGHNPARYQVPSGSESNLNDTIEIPDSGEADIFGLKDDTYILTEILGPSGWSVARPDFNFEITLQRQHQDDGTESLTQSIGSDPFGMVAGQSSDGNVVNVRYIGSIKDIPATSPVGAGVRILIGVMALMCGVGIFVGMKRLMRRRDAEDSTEA